MKFIYELLEEYQEYINIDVYDLKLDDAIDLLEMFSLFKLFEEENKKKL